MIRLLPLLLAAGCQGIVGAPDSAAVVLDAAADPATDSSIALHDQGVDFAVDFAVAAVTTTDAGDAAASPQDARFLCPGSCLYVATDGLDTNPGTLALPFLTIQHAADVVVPGDTVVVEDGTYSDASQAGPGSTLVNATRGGMAGSEVTFVAQHRWGAVLSGLNNTTAEAWELGADYLRVQGFEILGFSDTGISNYRGGHFVSMVGNHIHDIGRYCTTTSIGRDGIFVSNSHVVIEQNLVHDIGRYVAGENGCAVTFKYSTNDHGIYVDGDFGGADDVMIRNNVFFRVERGWAVNVFPSAVDSLSVLNNTFVYVNPADSNTPGAILLGAPVTHARIDDNVFVQPGAAAIYLDPTPNPNADSLSMANNLTTSANLVYSWDGNQIGLDPAIAGLSYAMTWDGADPRLVATGSMTLDGASVPDAHLAAGSPALAAGVPLVDVTDDFDGVLRGNPPSIGAYEE